MTDHKQHPDRLLDENMKRIGAALDPPPSPTAAQLARWKRVEEAPLPIAKGNLLMRNRRLLAIAGPALAAAVALSVLLITPKHSTVNAAVIFQELRARIVEGFRLELNNIVEDGTRVDGYVSVRFANDNPDAGHSLEWAVADLRVNLGDDADELAGATLRVAGEFNDEAPWMYLRPENLPDDLVDREPMVFAAMNFLSGGVILDLTGLDTDHGFSAFNFGGDSDESDEFDDASADRALRIGIGIGAGADPDVDASRPGLSVDVRMEGLAENEDVPDGAAMSATGGYEMGEIGPILADVFAGNATAEQIQQLVALIEADAEVTLENIGSERVRLTATPRDDADWDVGVLMVDYGVGVGIERVTLIDVGSDAGSITMEFVDSADLDRTPRPSRQGFLDEGATTFRIGDLMNMLGGGD